MRRRDRGIALLFLAMLAVGILYGALSPGTYQDDDVDRYYLARQVWREPSLLLDRWAMPLPTALFAVPARLAGYGGVEAMTALVTALGALVTALAARRLGMRHPWAAMVWVFVQPLTLTLSFSALAEPVGALLLALVLWAWYSGRPGRALRIAGLLPLARIEAGVLLAAVLLAGWRRTGWRDRAIAVLPLFLWNVAGFALSGDPLFVLGGGGGKPLAGLGVDQYVRNAIVAWGPVVLFLLLWAAAARTDGERTRFPLFAAALVPLHLAVLSLLAWEALPFGRSVGFLRHMAVLAPAVALTAAAGGERWAAPDPASRRRVRVALAAMWPVIVALVLSHVLIGHSFVGPGRVEGRWIVTAALAAAGLLLLLRRLPARPLPWIVGATLLAAGWAGWTVRPIGLDSERGAVKQAVEYLDRYGLENAVVYCNHPWFFFLSGRDRYDQHRTPRLTLEALESAPPGSLVLWENHYGPRLWGNVPLERLRADPRFRRLLELTGGETEAFRLVLFERVPVSP